MTTFRRVYISETYLMRTLSLSGSRHCTSLPNRAGRSAPAKPLCRAIGAQHLVFGAEGIRGKKKGKKGGFFSESGRKNRKMQLVVKQKLKIFKNSQIYRL